MYSRKAGALHDNFDAAELSEVLKALEYCYRITQNEALLPLIKHYKDALK